MVKLIFPISVLAATLVSSTALPAEAQIEQKQASNQATVFQCVPEGQAFATIAQRGTRRSKPMIVWESYIFGPEYTPQQRCQAVSQKLTTAVAKNGGMLRNLLLTTGLVDGYMVVCYVNTGEPECNRSNTLFTLKPENARNPGAALVSLLRFGKTGNGTTLHESADDDIAVELEAAVDNAFASGNYESVGPSENIQPRIQPNNAPSSEDDMQGGF